MSNINEKKSKRPKKVHGRSFCYMVSVAAGCTPRMVQLVLAEDTNMETKTAQRVKIAAELIHEGQDLLIKKVKELVNF